MIFTWWKLRQVRKELDNQSDLLKLHEENFKHLLKSLQVDWKRLNKLQSEMKVFRSFLDHMSIEIIQTNDGSIVFKSNFKYTKVGHNGTVERCN